MLIGEEALIRDGRIFDKSIQKNETVTLTTVTIQVHIFLNCLSGIS